MAKKYYLLAMLALLPLCVPPLIKDGRAQNADNARAAEARAQFESGRTNLSLGGNSNRQQARELFLKAANQGHTRAMYYAAVMLDQGSGGPRNRRAAIEWYLKAANAGDPDAMFTLSKLYDEGVENLQRDQKKSREWYDKAIKAWESGAAGEASLLRHPE